MLVNLISEMCQGDEEHTVPPCCASQPSGTVRASYVLGLGLGRLSGLQILTTASKLLNLVDISSLKGLQQSLRTLVIHTLTTTLCSSLAVACLHTHFPHAFIQSILVNKMVSKWETSTALLQKTLSPKLLKALSDSHPPSWCSFFVLLTYLLSSVSFLFPHHLLLSLSSCSRLKLEGNVISYNNVDVFSAFLFLRMLLF